MKKILKTIAAIAVALVASTALFAENGKTSWSFYIGADAAFYPLSASRDGIDCTHFAPITGPYSGLEGRVTPHADFNIATPLGQHWLLKDANLVLGTSIEFTPVSAKPGISVTWTPLPFIVLKAAGEGGTGWDAGPFKGGLCLYDSTTGDYAASRAFKDWFYKAYAQGTFQFDTGAVIPGDWTHVVMQYTYQVYYEGLSSAKAQDIWKWQLSGDRVNGLRNYQCGILAYQMPLVFYRAGVMYELDGYYKASAFANEKFKGDFKTISISPLAQFKFNDHHMLAVLAGFSSRRGYYAAPTKTAADTGICISREWFFNRIAFSYTYNF